MDLPRTLQLARAARRAYGEGDGLAGFGETRLARGAMQALVLRAQGECILAFRGTDAGQLADWTADLDAAYTDGFGAKVHHGFLAGLLDLWAPVLAELPDLPLWVTGHSLGGALATLGALQAAGTGLAVAGVATFGSPAVGDAGFVKAFTAALGDRSDRWVHGADPVPRALNAYWGYAHVPRLRYLDREGRLREEAGWAARTWDRVLGWGHHPLEAVTAGVGDHPIDTYLRALERLAG